MNEAKVTNLIGMKIIGQHGRDIGVVADMTADVETWQLQTLEVKLNRATLDELKLKRPWFGTQTIHVPIGEISGATDNLVLKSLLEEMAFSGGEAAAADSPIEETAEAGASRADDRSGLTGAGTTASM